MQFENRYHPSAFQTIKKYTYTHNPTDMLIKSAVDIGDKSGLLLSRKNKFMCLRNVLRKLFEPKKSG